MAAAQSSAPTPAPTPKAAEQRTPAASKPSARDAELERAIRERFARSKISVNKFEIRVQGGVATITGRTNVLQHKGTATRLAKNAGARQVVNNVAVSDQAKQKASDNLAQGRRRLQVRRSEEPNR